MSKKSVLLTRDCAHSSTVCFVWLKTVALNKLALYSLSYQLVVRHRHNSQSSQKSPSSALRQHEVHGAGSYTPDHAGVAYSDPRPSSCCGGKTYVYNIHFVCNNVCTACQVSELSQCKAISCTQQQKTDCFDYAIFC